MRMPALRSNRDTAGFHLRFDFPRVELFFAPVFRTLRKAEYAELMILFFIQSAAIGIWLVLLGTVLLMAAMAGCGLHGFSNFVGEVTVFFGAWKVFPFVTGCALWDALLIGAIYMLRAVRNILHGPLAEKWFYCRPIRLIPQPD